MIEVEIKSKIEDNVKIMEQIKNIGGTYSHSERQHDLYFNAPDKDYKKTDEALRIREIIDENSKCVLTYKGPKIDSKSKTRKEIEVGVDEAENMADILVSLGFKASAVVNKIRRIFTYEDYTIALDKLDDLGYFIEIEYVANEDENIENIRDNIFKVFEKLEIDSEFEMKSYLELLEENNNK